MAENKECSTCFMNTKYACIKCKKPICNLCSTPEVNEDTDGWNMGKQVAYCYSCKRKTNLSKRKLIIDGAVPRDNLETHSRVADTRTISARNSFLNSDLDDDLLNSSSSSEDDPIFPQKEQKKKKRGRKAKWSQALLDDLVDIIISSENYKKKLIFTNQKNQRNGDNYEKVLADLKKRAKSRGDEVSFNSNQVRTKFKKCVSECRSAALTIKTATGIERFIEQKDYGKWFNDLFALVKTRDACRPELALEPSGLEENLTIPEDEPSTSNSSEKKEKLVINKRSRKRNKQDMVNETLNLIKSAIEKDPTKEVLSFLKEESEKAREYELKMMQMLNQSSASTSQPQQQYNIQYPDRNCSVWQYNAQSIPSPNQENGWTQGFFNTPPFS